MAPKKSIEELQEDWKTLYQNILPALSAGKDSCQPKWPVSADHCFARIILDNAVGKDTPWTEVLKAPAYKTMNREQITAAINMGNDIVDGKQDLTNLHKRSLQLRKELQNQKMAEATKDRNTGNSPMSMAKRKKRLEPPKPAKKPRKSQYEWVFTGPPKKGKEKRSSSPESFITINTEPCAAFRETTPPSGWLEFAKKSHERNNKPVGPPKKKSRQLQMALLWCNYAASDGTDIPKKSSVPDPMGYDPYDPTQSMSETTDLTNVKPHKVIRDDPEALSTTRSAIAADTKLTPFRRHCLLLLTQVPHGRYSTYQAMSDHISATSHKTCARAVGNAMRNNPYAPSAPCHRILATGGKLGGFKGEWGDEGKFAGEKKRLLREEGVRFDGKGVALGTPFREFKQEMIIAY